MKQLFVFLTIVILLLLSTSSGAQEDTADELQAVSDAEQVTESVFAAGPAAEPSAEAVAKPAAEPEKTVAEAVSGGLDIGLVEEEVMHFAWRFGIALAIIAGQALLIWLILYLFKRLNVKIDHISAEKIKPLTIKKLRLLSTRQIVNVIHFLLRILKYIVTVFQLFLTVPIVFSLFPATKNLASVIFGYILTPLKNIAISVVKYIPNLFTIIIIIVITRYVLRAIKFFAVQISRGKLVIPGFYADWAEPTLKILQVLLLAFTVAIVYPYLPGSESRIFQGVSVFVGIIFSLGSSSAIGNLVAGLVITYMRSFKIGDRVKINEITGFVVEKNPMVIRLKTHKNEYVTFPNLTILSSSIVNYNTSSDEDEEGLIIYAEITYGYATPWQTIHDILINAALATHYVQKKPKPFVHQTALDDFYVRYQINCYTKEVDKVPAIYTLLYENIQNGFRESGMDMTTPHYEISIGRKEKG